VNRDPERNLLIYEALKNFKIWSHLGWRDLRAQYARTKIGPWWSAASLAAIIAGTSLAIGLLGNNTAASITPRLAIGLSIWTFFSVALSEGAGLFENERSLLLNSTIDETSLVLRVIWRNAMIYLHNLPVVLLGLLVGGYHFTPYIFLLIPISLLVAPMLIYPVFLFARLTLWQRDLKSLLPSVIQVGFFLTPIFWTPPATGPMHFLFQINPAAWLVILAQNAVLQSNFHVDLFIRLCCFILFSLVMLELSKGSLRNVRKLI